MAETENIEVCSRDEFCEYEYIKQRDCKDSFESIDWKGDLQSCSLNAKSLNHTLQTEVDQNAIRQYHLLLDSLLSTPKTNINHSREIESSVKNSNLTHNVNTPSHPTVQLTAQQLSKSQLEGMYRKLLSHNFILLKAQNVKNRSHELHVKIISKNQNYDIVELFCQLGRYSKKYIVLNVKQESFRHYHHIIGNGSFGNVHGMISPKGQKVAIKCLKFSNQFIKSLKLMIEEFMIADIMSAAEIGPKILRRSGFDFILFPRCMEFQMEICSQIKLQTLNSDLKENLQKMHLLKIIHSDIKPNNIMFSEYLNKNVLIDFGVASVLGSQLWQKTETGFRGTYEFVGEEMKKSFINHQTNEVNLYLNDAESILNSVNKIDKENLFFQKMQFRDIMNNSAVQLQGQNLEMEMTLRFKYNLYCFHKNGIVTSEFDQFFKELAILIEERGNVHLIKTQIQSCLKDIKISSKEIIFSNMILQRNHNQRMYNVLYNLLFEQTRNLSNQKPNSSECKNFQLICQSFEDQKILLESLNNHFPFQNKKAVSQNLRFILCHTEEILKFSTEEYFQLLLEFTSFWKGSVKISIEEKQKAAAIMRSLFENQHTEKNQGIKYLEPIYLPKQPFVNKNCRNMVWVYGYLLSHCMSGQFDCFKFRNLMTIAKDCIFLSFQYDLFLFECLQKYIHFIIKERTQMLTTWSVIQCFQIYSLTSRHFLIETSRLKSNKQKTYYLMKDFLSQCNTYIEEFEKNQLKKDFAQRYQNVFMKVWWMLDNRFSNEFNFKFKRSTVATNLQKQNIRNLMQLIEWEFLNSKDLQDFAIFEKAKRLIYILNENLFEKEIDSKNSSLFPSIHQFNNFEDEFDVLSLFQMDTELIEQAEENFLYVERKINCQDISKFFSLPSLFTRSFKKKDIQGMESVLRTVYTNFESSFLNLNIVIKIAKEKQKFGYFVIVNNSPQYMKQKRRIIFKAIQLFSEHPFRYVKQIVICEILLINFDFLDVEDNQITSQDIEIETKLFQSLFQKLYLNMGINYVTLRLGFNILHHLNLYQKHLGRYLQFRLQFFRIILQQTKHRQNQLNFVKSDKQLIGKLKQLFGNKLSLSEEDIRKYERVSTNTPQVSESAIHFFNQIEEANNSEGSYRTNIFTLSGLSNYFEQRSNKFCQTYFQIKKLKTVLFQKFHVAQFANDAIQFYIKNHNFNQIFQLLVQFAIETYLKKSPIQYNLLVQKLTEFKINFFSQMHVIFVGSFLDYLFKLETKINKIINPVVLFPLYMNLLNYQQYFFSRQDIHKKILIKVLLLLEKFLVFNSNLSHYGKSQLDKLDIKHELSQETIHFSMKYANRWKGERKMKILRKQLFKNIIQVCPEMIQYLKHFVLRVFKPNKQSNLERKIYHAFCKFGNKFLKNLTIIEEDLKEEKKMSQKTQSIILENKKIFKIEMRRQQVAMLGNCEKDQYKKLREQTVEIRKKLMDLEFQQLCEILQKQKGKKYQEISWIVQLN